MALRWTIVLFLIFVSQTLLATSEPLSDSEQQEQHGTKKPTKARNPSSTSPVRTLHLYCNDKYWTEDNRQDIASLMSASWKLVSVISTEERPVMKKGSTDPKLLFGVMTNEFCLYIFALQN